MIDLYNNRDLKLLYYESGNILEGIRLQNAFYKIQIINLL